MEASVVDLRYKTKEIIRALDRNEKVEIFYRGVLKGSIEPAAPKKTRKSAAEHPFFGMYQDEAESVESVMEKLRSGRVHVV
ncbi:MAG: hypothetical protein AB7E49_04885 [Campylobacterales bacterium]